MNAMIVGDISVTETIAMDTATIATVSGAAIGVMIATTIVGIAGQTR